MIGKILDKKVAKFDNIWKIENQTWKSIAFCNGFDTFLAKISKFDKNVKKWQFQWALFGQSHWECPKQVGLSLGFGRKCLKAFGNDKRNFGHKNNGQKFDKFWKKWNQSWRMSKNNTHPAQKMGEVGQYSE